MLKIIRIVQLLVTTPIPHISQLSIMVLASIHENKLLATSIEPVRIGHQSE